MRNFASFHPITTFAYFFMVIFCTMFSTNPLVLGLSLAGGLALYTCGRGLGASGKMLLGYLPVCAVFVLTNMLFVHEGGTVIGHIGGNALTLEAILYGLNMSLMLMAIVVWFSCYSWVMSEDKMTLVLGKRLPRLALVFGMVMRYLPTIRRKWHEIEDAQKVIGTYSGQGFYDRVRGKIRVLSSLISWSMEGGIITADSMRARGYGLKGRTSYTIYRWCARDILLLVSVVALGGVAIGLLFAGAGSYDFYPFVSQLSAGAKDIVLYVAVGLLSLLPVVLEIQEGLVWICLQSKM